MPSQMGGHDYASDCPSGDGKKYGEYIEYGKERPDDFRVSFGTEETT